MCHKNINEKNFVHTQLYFWLVVLIMWCELSVGFVYKLKYIAQKKENNSTPILIKQFTNGQEWARAEQDLGLSKGYNDTFDLFYLIDKVLYSFI